MRVTPAIEKLRNIGYSVVEVKTADLPMSMRNEGPFYRLSIGGQQVWHQQDRYGWYLLSELTEYSNRLPNVNQASFAEAFNAPF